VGGLVVVTITLPRDREPYEALAHELEHVLEYLDHGSLRALAHSGARQSEVWASTGAVETRRAIDAGTRAAREVERAAMLSARMRGSNPTAPGLKP
jgi:hypothetical protein